MGESINKMKEKKMIDIVLNLSSTASLYEMLAEEASELAQAASKYARYLRNDQPLSEEWNEGAGFSNVIEEFGDVNLCFDMIVRDRTSGNFESAEMKAIYDAASEDTKRKLKRWAERLER